MSLNENKAGAAAVDPADFNVIVDAVAALQASGSGLPEGWEQTGDPANVDSNGGNIDLGAGQVSAAAVSTEVVVVGTFLHSPYLDSGTTDPTSGDGLARYEGSIYMRSNGQAWLKTGAGDTAWTQIGGSPAGAIQVVRVPIAFNTANLVSTGITVYTPAIGDVLLDTSFLSITTAWDGSTPGIYLYSNGDTPGGGNEIISHYSLTSENAAQGSSTKNSLITATMGSMYLNGSSGQHIIFDNTAPLKLMVDDGSSGNPGSMAGAGEFVLIIAPVA